MCQEVKCTQREGLLDLIERLVKWTGCHDKACRGRKIMVTLVAGQMDVDWRFDEWDEDVSLMTGEGCRLDLAAFIETADHELIGGQAPPGRGHRGSRSERSPIKTLVASLN
eukprot:411604-Pelagomonas_calceolata.AAC.4